MRNDRVYNSLDRCMFLLVLLIGAANSTHQRRKKKSRVKSETLEDVKTPVPLDDDEKEDSDDDVFTPETEIVVKSKPTKTRTPKDRTPVAKPVVSTEEPIVDVYEFERVPKIKYVTPPFVSSTMETRIVIDFDSSIPETGDATLKMQSDRIQCKRLNSLQVECVVGKHSPGEIFFSVDFGSDRVTEAYPIVYVGGIYLENSEIMKYGLIICVIVAFIGFLITFCCCQRKKEKDKQSGVSKTGPHLGNPTVMEKNGEECSHIDRSSLELIASTVESNDAVNMRK